MRVRVDIYLRTDRLALRRFTEADADLLDELHNDPEVMRFLNGGKPTPREEIVGKTLPRFVAEGFYAAFDGATFIGWFHLRGPVEEPELGYRLHRAAWGKGYATEGSLALIDRAFALGARRVYAQTMTVNTGSRRVMEKCGMRFVRTFFEDWPDLIDGSDQGEVEYELLRADWEARS
ncbi:GNAT family N-acetyltransferase [Nonomuraea sp. SBT364]|uniref:GNAT family N-acetyltransferase n=1 Tax=Nonomuraea sp. SBT364 TaxID=1580530 RepID=UPI000B062D3B|nr:GNAT family N-acetyltransferase [Nonomuraea sp. SBT364]